MKMENETEKLESKEPYHDYFVCEMNRNGRHLATVTVGRLGRIAPKLWQIRIYTDGDWVGFFYAKAFRGTVDEAKSEAILFFHENMEALDEKSTN